MPRARSMIGSQAQRQHQFENFNIFRKLLIQTVPDILTDCVQGRHMHFTVEDCMILSALTKTDSQFR